MGYKQVGIDKHGKKVFKITIELGTSKEDIVKFGDITRVLGGRPDNSDLPKNIYYVFAKDLGRDKEKQAHILVNSVKRFIRNNSGKIDRFFVVNKEKPSSPPEREALQAEH